MAKLDFELYENLPAGIIITEKGGRIIDANKAILEILGYTNKFEIIGKNAGNFYFNPEDRIKVIKLLEKGPVKDFLIRGKKKDGSKTWFSITSAPVKIREEGTEYISILEDRTKQIEDQEKLLQYFNLFEESLNEIYIFDAITFRFIEVNQAAQKNIGYSRNELLKLTPVDIKPEFTFDSFSELVLPLLEGQKKKITFNTIHQRKDKSRYPVEVHLQLSSYNNQKTYTAIILDITEREKSEKALTLSEEKYKAVVEDQTEYIFRWKPDGTRIFVNKAYAEYYGKTIEELTGTSFVPDINPDSWQQLSDRINHLTPENPVSIYEHKSQFQGQIVWKEWTDRALFDLNGNIYEIQSTGRNITKRKQTEEELVNSRERLKITFDNSPDGYMLFDSKGNIIDVNKETEHLLNIRKEEILDKNFYDLGFISIKDLHEFVGMMDYAQKGNIPLPAELSMVNRRAEKILVEMRLFPVKIELSDFYLGIIRDITLKKRSEIKLQESEKRYRTLFEKSADPTLIIENETFIECNDATLAILHMDSRDAIIGKTPWEISPEKQPDGQYSIDKAKIFINQALSDGRSRFEWIHLNAFGEELNFDISLTLIKGDASNRIYTVWRDITAQKKAEKESIENQVLLKSTLESIQEGILVVNNENRVTHYNSEFLKQWNIPPELIEKKDDNLLLQFVLDQLKSPEEFISKVRQLYKTKEVDLDIIEFKDGRKFDRHSFPLVINNSIEGRVWGFYDITERLKAEEKLRESEERFKQLIEYLPDAIFVSELGGIDKGKILDVNKAAEYQTGYSREELIGKMIGSDLLETYNEDKFFDDERKLIEHGILRLTERKRRKNGEIYWVEVLITTIVRKGKKVTLSVNRDITELRDSEKALYESQQNLLMIYETAGVSLLHIKVLSENNYLIASVNKTYLHFSGRQKENIENRKIEDVFSPEAYKIAIEKYKEAITQKSSINWEETEIIPTGKKSGSVTATPVFDLDGNCVSIIVVIHDITEKKEIEAKIYKSQEELERLVQTRTLDLEKSRKAAMNLLQDSNEQRKKIEETLIKLKESNAEIRRLSQAVEQNPAAVTIINTKGEVEYVNHYYTEKTGFTLNEISGSDPELLIFSNTLPVYRKNIWNDISNGKTWSGEIENVHKDGDIFWESVSISPLFDENKSIIGFVQVGQDISHRKKLESDLLIAKERADEATKAKSEFLANMSHEIRTPINAILGFADLLSVKITDAHARNYLESLKTSGKSLLNLINDILDLSKVEAGMVQLNFEFIDLYSLFKDLQQIFSIELSEKKLDFIIEIDKKLPSGIFLDEARLRQILINLVNNAVKFTEKGFIKLSAKPEKGFNIPRNKKNYVVNLVIEVEDSGIGIPEEFQKIIFDSFTQREGHDTKKYGGTGLGLAISQKLVRLMGGYIYLNSKVGIGSKFTIVLENIMVTTQSVSREKTEHLGIDDIIFEPQTVLIVDDVRNNLLFLSGLLEHAGLQVSLASDGREAIQSIKANIPDLVITDIKMPVIDGIELLEYIRKSEDFRNIPVICSSASAMKESAVKLREFDFDGVLTKPIQVPELLTEIKKFIRHKIIRNHFEELRKVDYSLNQVQETNLPETIRLIEDELMPLWEQIKERQPVKKVELFGKMVIKVGENQDLEGFKSYGNDIVDAVNSFNVEGIVKLVKIFPDLVAKLRG